MDMRFFSLLNFPPYFFLPLILITVIVHCKVLNLHDALEAVRNNETDILDLTGTEILPLDMRQLADALKDKCFSRLHLVNCQISNDKGMLEILAEALEFSALTELNLADNGIGEEGTRVLAKALSGSQLKNLNLNGNQIGVNGLKDLVEMVKVSYDLEILSLANNRIGADGARFLAEVLADTNLIHLNLDGNGIGDLGVEALVNNLLPPRLTHLSLMQNAIGYKGAVSIAKTLRAFPLLNYLSLNENGIGDEGVEALTQAFNVSHLGILCLASNQISAIGARHLALALEQSKLNTLVLSNNNIRDEGVKALAIELAKSSLTHLDLSFNLVSEEGVRALAPHLKLTKLTWLGLSDRLLTIDHCMELNEILQDKDHDFVDDNEMVKTGSNFNFSYTDYRLAIGLGESPLHMAVKGIMERNGLGEKSLKELRLLVKQIAQV